VLAGGYGSVEGIELGLVMVLHGVENQLQIELMQKSTNATVGPMTRIAATLDIRQVKER
jgi:hypothetical protein